MRFFYFFTLMLLSIFNVSAQKSGNALLLSGEPVENSIELLQVYCPNPEKGKTPTIQQLQDSLDWVIAKIVQDGKASNYKIDEKTQATFLSLLRLKDIIQSTKDFFEKKVRDYYGNEKPDFILFALLCHEQKEWGTLRNFLQEYGYNSYKIGNYNAFKKYIYPLMGENKDNFFDLMLACTFMQKADLDTYRKDNPDNIEILNLMHHLWAELQKPEIKNKFQNQDAFYAYQNSNNENDTLWLYLEGSWRDNNNYQLALEALFEEYKDEALYFEDLKKAPNGYLMAFNDFMKAKIDVKSAEKSAYANCMKMLQILESIDSSYAPEHKWRLNLEWLENNPNCEQMLQLIFDDIIYKKPKLKSNASAIQLEILSNYIYPSALRSIQCDSILEKFCKKIIAETVQGSNAIDGFLKLHAGQYSLSSFLPEKEWENIMNTRLEEALAEIKTLDNDTAIFNIVAQYYSLNFSKFTIASKDKMLAEMLPRVKNKTFAFLLRYEALKYKCGSAKYQYKGYEQNYKENVCGYISEYNYLLQEFKNAITKDTIRIDADGYEYYLVENISSFIQSGYTKAINSTFEYARMSDDDFNTKYSPTTLATCFSDSTLLQIPDYIRNDKNLLKCNYFAQQKFDKKPENHFVTVAKMFQQKRAAQTQTWGILFVEFERMDFFKQHIQWANPSECNTYLYNELLQLKKLYDTTEAVALVYERMMDMQEDSSKLYIPDNPSTHQYRWHRRAARNLYIEFKRKHPKSEHFYWTENNITRQVTYLGAQYPTTVASGIPFQLLVTVENVDTIYVLIKNYENKNIAPITLKIPNKPENNDLHRHKVEITLPPLLTGMYDISLSPCDSFARCGVQNMQIEVSPVWLLGRKKNTAWKKDVGTPLASRYFYLLHRATGEPLTDVTILWKKRVPVFKEGRNGTPYIDYYGYPDSLPFSANFYPTTANGLEICDECKLFAIVWQGDTINVQGDYTNAPYLEPLPEIQCEIFTDRAIYRTGQELLFKVIAAKTEEGNVAVCEDCPVTVELLNFKREVIDYKSLITGYFGADVSSFLLNEKLMGGQYYLRANGDNNTIKAIRIEAYKRPTFEVNFAPISRPLVIGDSVCLEAQVSALAGYAVQNATVQYSLDLKLDADYTDIYLDEIVDYDYNGDPIFRFRSERKITKGNTKTDDSGYFQVCFASQPVTFDVPSMSYQYILSADITDEKGETQNTIKSITLSRQAYQTTVNIPEYINAAKPEPIGINVYNAAGLPVRINMGVKVHKLKTPAHFFNYRLWENPDDTLYSAASLAILDKHAIHWKEDQQKNWRVEKTIQGISVNNISDYNCTLPSKLPQGAYRIDIEITDSSGRKTTAQHFFTVIDWESTTLPFPQAFFAHCPKTTYSQEEDFKFYLGSSQPNASALVYLSNLDSIVYHQWHNVAGKKAINIPLKDIPTGEVQYFVYMVLHNRIYTQSGTLSVLRSSQKNKGNNLNVSFIKLKKEYKPQDEIMLEIAVTDKRKKQVEAQLTVSMYDASLDKFAPHRFAPRGFSASAQGAANFKLKGSLALDYYSQLATEYTNAFTTYDTITTFDPETFQEVVQTVGNEKQGKNLNDILLNAPKGNKPNNNNNNTAFLRTNLNETTLWDTYTSSDGRSPVLVWGRMNDMLTRWNILVAAHSKDGRIGTAFETVISSRPLIVQPNIPRFVRQNDTIVIAALVVNQSDKKQRGDVVLSFLDPLSKKPTNSNLLLQPATQTFNLDAHKSQTFMWRIALPDTAKTLLYRVIAQSGKLEDGEQSYLFVLSDKSIEIRQQQLSIRGGETKTMTLPADTSQGNKPVQLKLNVSYNLSWDVLQSLPALIENPYECSEQLVNRIYGNELAQNIISNNQELQTLLKTWRDDGKPLPIELSDPALSEKIKRQTPWLFDLGSDDAHRQRFARLLNESTFYTEKQKALDLLLKRQTPSGGFSWYGGRFDDLYITMYVLQVQGHFKKLTNKDLLSAYLHSVNARAMVYVEKQFVNQYNNWLKIVNATNADLSTLDIRHEHLHLLYTETFYTTDEGFNNSKPFYTNKEHDSAFVQAKAFVLDLLEKQWQRFTEPISLGHIALVLHRNGKTQLAENVLDTLLNRSFVDSQDGRYWFKDYGYYWYNAPIETQALLIEAFAEIRPNDKNILQQLKTWLLLQREGGSWATSKATSAAATALMIGSNWLSQNNLPDIQINGTALSFTPEQTTRNMGKLSRTWTDENTLRQNNNISIKNNNAEVPVYADAALFVLKPLSQIKATPDTNFRVQKLLYKADEQGNWILLPPHQTAHSLTKGDKIKVELRVRIPKYMEYLHLYDQHPSGFEPIETRSDVFYEDWAFYYRDVRDEQTNFFFNSLSQGEYSFSRTFWVANAGVYQSGIATIECMYAPKFRAHTGSQKIVVSF